MRLTDVGMLVGALTLLAACEGRSPDRLRIGAKPFAEQAIMTEAVRLLAIDAGIDAEVVPCPDSYVCHRHLRDGRLDLMIQYSGTALQFVGGPRPLREQPVKQVRRLYEPLGLVWLDPLGFDNGYRLLVPQRVGATKNIHSIEDLVHLGSIRIATPAEFLRRPRDGLPALLRRYGLALSGEPLQIEDPAERFQALRDGRADVAVGYATDGVIVGAGLQSLDDPLDFFPPYAAAVVVRRDALRRHDGLRQRLESLSGRFTNEIMQRLNGAAQIEGHAPIDVARRFLREAELLDESEQSREGAASILLGFDDDDGLNLETATAIRALRRVFPDHVIRRRGDVEHPLREIAHGHLGFAVVSGEHFFRGRRQGRAAPAEAVALLGTHVVHLLRREPVTDGEPLAGRIGLTEEGSGARIGAAILALDGTEPALAGEPAALLRRLLSNDLDGALIVAARDDAIVARALSQPDDDLRLVDLGRWLTTERAVRLPYLRRVRVTAGRRENGPAQVETLGVQIVLAGPRPESNPAGAGGPAAALPSSARPLTSAQLELLTEATGILEIPDSVIPSAWTAGGSRAVATTDATSSAILDTLLNVLVTAFLAWLVWLVAHRQRDPTES